jgi:hypothetical protein
MGLPIIMSFMPEKFEARNRNRTTFMLDNTEGRHASPLLFRPLLTAKGAVGLIIILAKSRIDYPVRLSTNERYTPHEQTISPRGSHDVRNHGNDRNLDPKPHGPTNTADVIAGVFAYMQQ